MPPKKLLVLDIDQTLIHAVPLQCHKHGGDLQANKRDRTETRHGHGSARRYSRIDAFTISFSKARRRMTCVRDRTWMCSLVVSRA
eukprot:6189578-Pleurochrysis_carterae.AAC.3